MVHTQEDLGEGEKKRKNKKTKKITVSLRCRETVTEILWSMFNNYFRQKFHTQQNQECNKFSPSCYFGSHTWLGRVISQLNWTSFIKFLFTELYSHHVHFQSYPESGHSVRNERIQQFLALN